MGSFNETCALSGLNIPNQTPIRLFFLVQNPYVSCDEHEAQRGCYHHDNWFVRTPPIKGKYDDYGQAAFKEGPITDLISKCFDLDVLERPYGFNQYHASSVTKGNGIRHYLQAAWQGRLLVEDYYSLGVNKPLPGWPTWQEVHSLFSKAALKLQSKTKDGERGYNAQPVIPGVVCVTYQSYSDTSKHLKKAEAVLSEHYDCRFVKKFKDRDDQCLIVTAKGAFDNLALLMDEGSIRSALTVHPQINRSRYRALSVLAVMVREDVWRAYCNVAISKVYVSRGRPTTVKGILEVLTKKYNELKSADPSEAMGLIFGGMAFDNILQRLPSETMLPKHLMMALEDKEFKAKAELLRSCAEMARVEYIMAVLHQAWSIPCLGGQDPNWALQTRLRSDILAISQKQLDLERAEYGDDEDG
jgi:hypothetical protein